jgi:cation transport regulator ChaC
VEKNREQQYQSDSSQQGQSLARTLAREENQQTGEIVPGIPVIRSSTPRPLSFDMMVSYSGYFRSLQPSSSAFPERAPSAPPLPEEMGECEDEHIVDAGVAIPPTPLLMLSEGPQEFIWLFEYGLDMDPAILNDHERLNGCALLYGPAVLKGYTLLFGTQHGHKGNGSTVVAIVPSIDLDAEVWGVIYRIPQRVAEGTGKRQSLLDTIHTAVTPQSFFKGVQVVVHEIYRDQDISALTYVATDIACQELQLALPAQSNADALFVQRLADIARGHKLPHSYISQYSTNQQILSPNEIAREAQAISKASQGRQTISTVQIPPSALPMTNPGTGASERPPLQGVQNTDPLPTIKEGHSLVHQSPALLPTSWPLTVFSIYLAILLVIVLMFAVLQGMGFGQGVLTNSFTLLGVPWLVTTYGLLGGCISSLITLGHLRTPHLPLFVVIVWFVRPYIGAVLAIFAYILLTSGLFIAGQSVEKHMAFFWLVGALAGFCEGWIFFRRS